MSCDVIDWSRYRCLQAVIVLAFACTLMMPLTVAADDLPQGKDYRGQTLTGTNFLGADLKKADFRGATLNGVVFAQADLTGADFSKATFGRAAMGPTDFSLANLTGAKFNGVRLDTDVSFMHAVIKGADFSGMDRTRVRFGPLLDSSSDVHSPRPLEWTATVNSIHVAIDGVDGATCGTEASNACATISKGIARCEAQKPCTVLVGYGVYELTEPIALKDGVSLTGGCVDGNPTTYLSSIKAPPGGLPALTANGVTSKVDRFILTGTPATDPTRASVVVQVTNTAGFELVNSNVHAGSGKDAGAAVAGSSSHGGNSIGIAGGTSTCNSTNAGGRGGDATVTATCSGKNANCRAGRECSYASGTPAGTNGNAGQSTAGAGTSPASVCSWNEMGSATPQGGRGGTGADATKQATLSDNRIGRFNPDGTWAPVAGDAGQRGNDGGGGGGGGGGTARVNTRCNHAVNYSCSTSIHDGQAGGGGGAGGCGGSGGQGGAMGSASFGIVLVNSRLKVSEHLTISGAQGGNGGDGGPGVAGGRGGWGGNYLSSPHTTGAAQPGDGGFGGNGGSSGGGAGGNGGPSVGIVLVGTSALDRSPTTIYPGKSGLVGKGGLGGNGAPAGANGQSGLAQASYEVK